MNLIEAEYVIWRTVVLFSAALLVGLYVVHTLRDLKRPS